MSTSTQSRSIAASFLCATALLISASPVMAQRPASGQSDPQRPPQEAPPPAPTRPQTPPPPAPTREQNARTEQQREEAARAQQQEQKRIENARQDQAVKEQERIARARQAGASGATTTDPKNRDTIGRLMAAEKVHREQLARINRLKQIAERQSQKDRVAELDRLLLDSNSTFDHKLQVAKTELPEPEYNNTVKMLEQGRRREVRSMMGGGEQGADPAQPHRAPATGAVQAPQRVTTPERPKQEPAQPPH